MASTSTEVTDDTSKSTSISSNATAAATPAVSTYKPFFLSDPNLMTLIDGCSQGPQAATGESAAFFRENTKVFTPGSDREFHPDLVRSAFALYNLLARSAAMLGADMEGLLPNDVRKNFLRDFILYMARDVLGSVPFPHLLVNGLEMAVGRANPASTLLRDAARIMFCSVGCGQLLRIKDHDVTKRNQGWDVHYVASALHTKMSAAQGEEAAELEKELKTAEGQELLKKLENLGLKNETEDLTWTRVNLAFNKDGYDARKVWTSLDGTYLKTLSCPGLSEAEKSEQTEYLTYVKAGCQATAGVLNFCQDASHHVRVSNLMTQYYEARLEFEGFVKQRSSEGIIGPLRTQKYDLREKLLKEVTQNLDQTDAQHFAQAVAATIDFCDNDALLPPNGARYSVHEVRQVQLLLTLPLKYSQWEHLFKEIEVNTGLRIFEAHAGATNMLISDMYVAVAWVIQRVAQDWEDARKEKKATSSTSHTETSAV